MNTYINPIMLRASVSSACKSTLDVEYMIGRARRFIESSSPRTIGAYLASEIPDDFLNYITTRDIAWITKDLEEWLKRWLSWSVIEDVSHKAGSIYDSTAQDMHLNVNNVANALKLNGLNNFLTKQHFI